MQNIKIVASFLSVFINVYAFFPYLKDIILKKTKPHIYTWLIWFFTQGIAVCGIWYGGGKFGAIELTLGTILVFLVFLFSFKNGTKNIRSIDALCLIFAFIAIFIWWRLHNPRLAVLVVCFIDACGYIPTFRKSWIEPWSETLISWILFSVADIFAICALSKYNFLTLIYLITLITFNLSLVILCYFRRQKILNPFLFKNS